jgi:putative heme-binding domain-containing protein
MQQIVVNQAEPAELRAEALLGLSIQAVNDLVSLTNLLDDASEAVRIELVRGLRPLLLLDRDPVRRALAGKLERGEERSLTPAFKEQLELALFGAEGSSGKTRRPASEEAWVEAAISSGDVGNGRRVFFHPVAGCATCHRIDGRGGLAGPDLSVIGRSLDRVKLAQAILNPSWDIAPQFVAHMVEARNGETYAGLVEKRERDGSIVLLLADGRRLNLPPHEILSVRPSTVSLMPEGLENSLTLHDFRDLVVFLNSLK